MKLASLALAAATAVIPLVQIFSTTAPAYSLPKWRTCPDGIKVQYSRPCPTGSPDAKLRTRLPLSFRNAVQQSPPAGDSAAHRTHTPEWRNLRPGDPGPVVLRKSGGS